MYRYSFLFPFSCLLPYVYYNSFLFCFLVLQNGVLYRGVSPDVLMLDQKGYLQVSAILCFMLHCLRRYLYSSHVSGHGFNFPSPKKG